jgi:hypothetical protein
MTAIRKLAALAVAALPLAAVAEDPSPMQEGLWEISLQLEIPNMPFKPPATTMKHCYTKQELADQGVVPQQEKDCKVTDVKRTASSVSWKTTCTGKNAGTGEGQLTFSSPTAYEGSTKMTTGGTTLTTVYKGKRLGDCK